MRWRVEVARRLRTHLVVGPEASIAVIARRRRDVDALCKLLPGAIEFGLSDGSTGYGGAEMVRVGDRRESTGGDALTESVPARGSRAGGLFRGRSLAEGTLDVVVACLVATRLSAPRRRRLLEQIRGALRAGGTLVVVDHNRPRTWWRWLGNVGWCLLRGVEPCARPAYPVAREMKDAAFERISLRMAFRERIQIVCGVRSPGASDVDGTDDAGDERFPR